MYRAQRIAEYALYDGDPTLFDTELNHYLQVRPEQIQNVVRDFLDIDNRVVLDIVPQMLAEPDELVSASPQPPGEPSQPAAPAPQLPARPTSQPTGTRPEIVALEGEATHPEKPEQPTDPPKQTRQDSGPLHR
jgi:hypothetical protein